MTYADKHLPALRPAWNLSSAFKTQKGCQRKYFPVHHRRSSVSLSRYSIMLNDADASGFKKVYLAMGFTDLRISGVGLMVLQTSSGFSFNWILMIKIRCFSFVGENATGSRHYFGKETGFSLCTKDSTMVHSDGHALRTRQWPSQKNSTTCWCRVWRLLRAIRFLN